MKKLLLLPLILLFQQNAYSQINVDSIVHEVMNSGKFIPIDTLDYFDADFIRYKSKNESEIIELYLDSNQKVSEHIGLSLVQRKLDSKGRVIYRIGCNRKGNYYFFDFSPIIILEYQGDSITRFYYNYKQELTHKTIIVTDAKGRETDYIKFDKKLNFKFRESTIYNDERGEKTVHFKDLNDQYLPLKNGVAVIYEREYSKTSDTLWLKAYYDKDMQLVDADHIGVKTITENKYFFSYILIHRSKDGSSTNFKEYYNSHDKLLILGSEAEYFFLGN